ncbi:MAG: hypothetical protein WC657_00455 [Candidatus Paceibacterota bacterium]|jgi:hypothetical protein
MPKKSLKFAILIVSLVGISVPNIVFGAGIGDTIASMFQLVGDVTFGPLLASIGYVLMTLSSLILIFSGWILDTVIQYTIVEVSTNLGDSVGLGKTITTTWETLRDVANMAFIFVLLYAAFKAMFDSNFGNFQTTIRNIIIVALLINFSLFFSKVVIDASNIVAVGFYKSIAANNMQLGSTIPGGSANFKGISGGYMRMLGLQTWYGINILDGGINAQNILITGIMSSIFMLMSAIFFLIVGIMFATRFILLVFLMILSPLALIAYIIPGQSKKFDEWKDALIAQSFFAPLYFALTWVAFNLGNSLFASKSSATTSWIDLIKDPAKNQEGAMALLLNYVLIMGFAIAALVISKTMASKTAGFKAISGGIGAVAIGGTAWAQRQIIGRGANAVASDKNLQERAARGDLGARMKLATAQKLAGSSFDVRGLGNSKLAKSIGADSYINDTMGIVGKAGGVGGFSASASNKDEKRRKRTDDVMKRFKTQPEILADHLSSLSPSDQKYMYEKLSARDRAALDEVLDNRHVASGGTGTNPTTTRLRSTLSLEEKEKTEKSAKEAKNDAVSRERIDEIHKIATNPAHAATFTAAALDSIISKLPPKQARKLSHEARISPLIIPRLNVRQLADLMSDGDLQPDEIRDIRAHSTVPQNTWMNHATRVDNWTP